MTGLPDSNYPAFNEAEERLRRLGHEPLNPARNFDGDPNRKRREYFREDFTKLLQAEGVALLAGWETSRGALAEVAMANELELFLFDFSGPYGSLIRTYVDIELTATATRPDYAAARSLSSKTVAAIQDTIETIAGAGEAPEPTGAVHRGTFQLNPDGSVGVAVELSAADRKARPLCTGVLDYFPDALMEVAYCSKVGNDQHNPGQPLHWAKEKSTDHADCVLRHLKDRGTVDSDGVRHSAKAAWRALANLQIELEEAR